MKKLWLKILVPVIIVAVIGGMWLIKNALETPVDSLENDAVIPDYLANADFTLNETQAIDFEELSGYGLPIIVDYGADSCIPCKEMAPVLQKLNAEFQGKAFIKFINVWEYEDAAKNVPIELIPTQIFVNPNGTPFIPSDTLAGKIQFDMYSDPETGEHSFTMHVGGLTEEEMRAILGEMGAR